MKYLILEKSGFPDYWVVFPSFVSHKDMAKTFEKDGIKTISAGKIDLHEGLYYPSHGSESLGIEPNGDRFNEDRVLLKALK